MAYFPVVGDILESRAYATCNNQVAVNIVHWNVFSVSAAGAIRQGDVATSLDAAWAALYKAIMAATATYYGVSVQKVFPLPKPVSEATLVSTGPGLGGPNAMPTQTRGILGFKTPLAGHAERGRLYLPFPPTAMSTPTGHPDVAYIAGGDALGAVLKTPFIVTAGGNTMGIQPILFNRLTHTTKAIVVAKTTAKWGTQKKSGDYGRPNQLPF